VKLSLVIPVYNEIPTLREIVSRIAAVDLDKELVFVDDMSTDGSREALSELRDQGIERWLSGHDKQRPRLRTNEVKVLLQPKNMGKGAALRAGFAAATGDIVVQRRDVLSAGADQRAPGVQPHPQVRRVAVVLDPRIGVARDDRAVEVFLAAVVRDEDLDVRIRLRERALDRGAEVARPVVRRHDDAHQRRVVQGPSG